MSDTDHQHRFTVPIEWVDGFLSPGTDEFVATQSGNWNRHRVTRLMCEICDEVKEIGK